MRSPRSSSACSNRIRCNSSLAALRPPSKYTAATTASKASASSVCFSRPPVFSSPRPNRRCSPKRRRRAADSSEPRFTMRARLLERWHSEQSGKAARRYSLASSSRTASPRNYSRSLSERYAESPGASALAPRNSGIAELWVNACSSSSRFENLWPRRSSNAASEIRIVSCIIRARAPPGLLWRAQLRSALLLGVLRLGFADGLHLARYGRAFIESRDRIIKMRSALVGHAKQVVIHGVRIRVYFHGLIEFRDGFCILSASNVDQSQSTMSHS